ncbi:hypothetical protein BDV98DRAFT_560285, partial [Pterulicium gracile]
MSKLPFCTVWFFSGCQIQIYLQLCLFSRSRQCIISSCLPSLFPPTILPKPDAVRILIRAASLALHFFRTLHRIQTSELGITLLLTHPSAVQVLSH